MNTTTQQQEPKDICWLPKSLAEKVKSMEDGRDLENEVFKYIEDSKRNLRFDLDGLDDNVLQYRAAMMKAKSALKEAFAQEMKDFEELWISHLDEFAKAKQKAMDLVEGLKPIKQSMAELNKEISSISKWEVTSLIEMLDKLKYQLDSESDTGKILKFLFENYKRA